MLNPVFLARNRLLTHVVAKQAKTTKVKNKSVNGKKVQKNTQLSFWWKAKSSIQEKEIGKKFKFALSVLLRTWLAHRLSSQLFAAVSTPNIAELVLFGFFCPQPWFSRQSEHILP